MKKYLSTALIISAFGLLLYYPSSVYADAVSTQVTVGNATPTFSAGPAEDPATTGTSPINVGSNVTFSASANEPNAENYYLAVCKTDVINNPGDGSAPTCAASQELCISNSTAHDQQASCQYTTLAGDDEETAWYAFLCDTNTSSQGCTSSGSGEQGTGDSGSPLVINHEPQVTVARGNNSPQDTGSNITWTVTATDEDTTSGDTYSMIVCTTDSITGSACDDSEYCSDRTVTSGVGATCNYQIPTPTRDGTAKDGYVFVIDNHNFGSSSNVTWDANNEAPVTSLATTNGGSPMTLNGEQSTTNFDITATVTDNNSCQDIDTVEAVIYRSSVSGGASCGADNNECYTSISCTVDGGTCTDADDPNATYTCTVSIQYHADPTVANSEYPSDTWISQVTSTDDDAQSHSDAADGVVLNMYEALDISSSLDFDTLSPDSTPSSITKTTTVTSTGNVGLDVYLQGDDMCTDYPTCSVGTPIDVGHQRYGVSELAWASATALTGSDIELETNFVKTTTTGSPTTGDIYWGVEIPDLQPAGVYSGQNDATAKYSESGEW